MLIFIEIPDFADILIRKKALLTVRSNTVDNERERK